MAPDVGPQGASLIFEVTVSDTGGLQGVDTCQVIVQAASPQPGPAPDTNAPVLVIDNPAGDYIVTRSRRINISGTASDDQQVDRVVWVNDRGQSGEATGTVSWYIDGMRLRRGENTFTITAYDAAGNFASKTITVRRTSH